VRKKEAVAAQRNAWLQPEVAPTSSTANGGDKKDAKGDKGGRSREAMTPAGSTPCHRGQSASQDGAGHWTIVTVEGAVWRQTTTRPLATEARLEGRAEAAALGSYHMKIDHPAVARNAVSSARRRPAATAAMQQPTRLTGPATATPIRSWTACSPAAAARSGAPPGGDRLAPPLWVDAARAHFKPR
jgi:hypothetical protein